MLELDPLLPRLVELACSAGDRQTKIAACELLHSVVVFMVGDSVQQHQHQSMVALYQHIFPVMLQLACNVETVAQQLFDPLVCGFSISLVLPA